MRFAPFFFFFFYEFRPNSADTGRYGPSRPNLGRVGPHRLDSGIATWHNAARTRGLQRPTRVAASDAGALAWEPRPCIPAVKHKNWTFYKNTLLSSFIFLSFTKIFPSIPFEFFLFFRSTKPPKCPNFKPKPNCQAFHIPN